MYHGISALRGLHFHVGYGILSPSGGKYISIYDDIPISIEVKAKCSGLVNPSKKVELTDADAIKYLNKTLDLLDDDDDVQAVYHNWSE